jgi:nicotinate-nucleotide--dimethylbenzimidazole phosphoribosyltransferase
LNVAELLTRLPGPNGDARTAIAERAAQVLRPRDAFARLDEIASWLASWQDSITPSVRRPALVIFVGDHGVTAEEVSAYPASVTAHMLEALRERVATATILAEEAGASIAVIDTGVGRPSGNIVFEPALDHDRFEVSFELGRRCIADLDADLLVLGEMGIGNTTAASALAATLFGLTADDWTGRGSGIDDETLKRKIEVVRRARERAGPCDPIEALRQLGGSEMVALAGAVVEARLRRLPVVLDGFVVTAAVAALELSRAGALDHCLAGHRSPEPGHQLLLEKLGMDPLLDLGLRLGEGSGALLAVPLLRMAARAVVDVATFDERGIE